MTAGGNVAEFTLRHGVGNSGAQDHQLHQKANTLYLPGVLLIGAVGFEPTTSSAQA